jgi:hypothetical protein
MLSPTKPGLAIFGHYSEPVVVNMAQTLAHFSGLPVVVRAASDNPALTLLWVRLLIPHSALTYSTRTHDTDHQHGHVLFDNSTSGNNHERGRVEDGDEEMVEDERTLMEPGNGGGRDNDLRDAEIDGHVLNTAEEHEPSQNGAALTPDGGDGGGGEGGPLLVDGKWSGPLHSTKLKLRLKLNTAPAYEVTVGYTFKVNRI